MSDEYMKAPLVIWLQTFSVETISYAEIIDGYILNEVMQQIDNKCGLEGVVNKIQDVNDKVHNWEIFLKNVRSFYQEVLQQYIILKPPDIFIICYQPDTASAKTQVDVALLLLLGCAVQCEDRESHVDTIKGLSEEVQHSIMQYIKEITDFSKAVLNVNIPLKDIDDSSLTVYTHLNSLINQRDSYIQEMKNLHQALYALSTDDYGRMLMDGQLGLKSRGSNRLSFINTEMSSLVGQAEYRAVLRKLKQELTDKSDLIIELEDELDIFRKEIQKLKIENFDLTQQSRMGKFYRDELDIYKEKSETVEKLEKEVQRYKEQMVEFDFLKDRVEELKVDNCVLMDNKKALEDQVETLKMRSQMMFDAEVELVKCRKALQDAYKMQEEDQLKLRNLTEKIEHLEREKEARKRVSFMEESFQSPRIGQIDINGSGVIGSLADQLLQASQSQILSLEAKLQKMELEMEHKFYFSENILKAFDLDKVKIKSEIKKSSFSDESSDRVDEDDGDLVLTRESLEKEMLRRVKLLKEDNEQLKNQLHSCNVLLESSRDKIKSLEFTNVKLSSDKQEISLQFEASERRSKNLIEERERLESELLELRKMADFCLNKTRDLESCLDEVRSKDEALFDERNEFEKEAKKLRLLAKEKSLIIEELENNISDMQLQIIDLRKTLESKQELEGRLHEMEQEVQTFYQNGNLDKKLIASLKEELVNEKIKTQNLNEDLLKINKKCEAYITGEMIHPKHRLTEKLYAEKLVEVEAKQKKLDKLQDSLDESKGVIEKLQNELSSSIKREETNSTKDRTLIVTQRYGQSQSATQEILKLKENVTKVEHQRDELLQENSTLRQQIESFEMSSSHQQSLIDQSYLESLEIQLQKNQSLLANMQVEHATNQMQKSAFENQVTQLKVSLAEMESKVECLTTERHSLEDNCRALQKLHDKLGVEYERLQEEHGSLKGVHRLLKTDLKSAKEKILSQEKSLGKFKNCQSESTVANLKDENVQLMTAVESLENDNKNLSVDLRKSRVEITRLKETVHHHHLQKQANDDRSIIVNLNSEIERLRRIEHMYNRTEEENQILNDQLRMYKSSLEDSNDTSTENQQQQKSLIERLSEMKGKSSKSEGQNEKNKKKIKKSQSIQERKSSDQSEDSKKDYISCSPLRKSQDDFLSIENSPVCVESQSISPFENTRFGDWKKKTVFRINKLVETGQQTCESNDKTESTSKKKSKRNKLNGNDEETITLNQFLSECNQSPKSRRKLLIQKRVALDDDVFCDKDLPLDPRPPVIFEKSQTLNRSFKSEGSFFNATDDAKRLTHTFVKTPDNLTQMRSNYQSGERQSAETENDQFTSPRGGIPKLLFNQLESSQAGSSKKKISGFSRQKIVRDHSSIDEPVQKKIEFDSYGSNSSECQQNWLNEKDQLESVDYARYEGNGIRTNPRQVRERDFGKPIVPRKPTTVSSPLYDEESHKVDSDVTYHSSPGAVRNLVQSYQRSASCYNNHNFNKFSDSIFSNNGNSSPRISDNRPKSAVSSQDRVLGRKFTREQQQYIKEEGVECGGGPKICLVRPATASLSKNTVKSSEIFLQEQRPRENTCENSRLRSGTASKSKVVYEQSYI